MNNLLKEILATGQVADENGNYYEVHSNVTQQAGEMLQKWINKVNCSNSVEVGLAFGVSSLFILDELAKKQNSMHYGIDPMQFNDRWHGLGLENIKRAGFEDIYKFYNEPSYTALPKILQTSEKFQFAFIDGWHTFDYTLVDFFYIDKMLDVGGVIVFDDVCYKSIRKVLTFVLSNLDYELVDGTRLDVGENVNLKSKIKSSLSVLSRDDWTPSSKTKYYFDQLHGMHTVVVRKTALDTRSFRHFCPF